jgi:NTE family protein
VSILYGLALEGGGARGSYQIGACRALSEIGYDFQVVAGTSIGALNGAMIVQDDLEKAYDLWYNISPSKLFELDEEKLDKILNMEITQDGILYIMKRTKSIVSQGGLDISLIKAFLHENIDEAKLRSSNIEFGFVTVSVSDRKPLELFIEDIPEGKLIEYLLQVLICQLLKEK